MDSPTCRWCAAPSPAVVLDLGVQPPSDLFPRAGDPGPDPAWPLRMGCCPQCGLAQLLEDPGIAEEILGLEPQALVDQALAAVRTLDAAGELRPGAAFAEFDSPHGGSWRALLRERGVLDRTGGTGEVDLAVDVFGLMHEADQAAALHARLDRLAPHGTLLLQFHSLASILAQGQWNALRHGHLAYYSTRALTGMLRAVGLHARDAWSFDLYGGTVLLAAGRDARAPGPSLSALLAADDAARLAEPAGIAPLAATARRAARELRTWLAEQRSAGHRVIGYAAASRTVPLLVHAGVDADLLPAVADGAVGKHGRRLPGTDVPIVGPDELDTGSADVVLVFVPDLLDEVRAAHPAVEERGGRWAVSEPAPRLLSPPDAAGGNRPR